MIDTNQIKTEITRKPKKKSGCYKCGSHNIMGFSSHERPFRRCNDCGVDWAVGGSSEFVGMTKQEREEHHREFNFNSKDRMTPFGDSEINMVDASQIEEAIEKNKSMIFGRRF